MSPLPPITGIATIDDVIARRDVAKIIDTLNAQANARAAAGAAAG